MNHNILGLLGGALLLVGCVSSQGQAGGLVTVGLEPGRQNLGQIAQATLADQGNETAISFWISGVPDSTTRPLHLYSYVYHGTCRQLGQVAYEMNDTVSTSPAIGKRGWTVSKKAPTAMRELLKGGYSIVLRTSPADGSLDVFCGDITTSNI